MANEDENILCARVAARKLSTCENRGTLKIRHSHSLVPLPLSSQDGHPQALSFSKGLEMRLEKQR